jgi:hypothetical protein
MATGRNLLLVTLSLAYSLAGAGCAPTLQWVKPGVEQANEDPQKASCTLQAETTYISSEEPPEARASRIARWTSLCMRANGWHQQAVESQ